MEVSYEEAQNMILMRLREYPKVHQLVSNQDFKATIAKVLEIENVPASYLPLVTNEVILVLTFYVPHDQLALNMTESTGLPILTCERIVLLLDTVLLDSILNELLAFEYHWNTEAKKGTDVSSIDILNTSSATEAPRVVPQAPIIPPIPPAPVPAPAPTTTQSQEPMRPLTRDELMQALEHRGQAGGNLDAIRQKLAAAASQPVIGYDALPPNEERAQ